MAHVWIIYLNDYISRDVQTEQKALTYRYLQSIIEKEVIGMEKKEYLDYFDKVLQLEQKKLAQDELYKVYKKYMEDNKPTLEPEDIPSEPTKGGGFNIGCGSVILILPSLLICTSIIVSDWSWLREIWGIGVLGFFIWGIAMIVYGIREKKKEREEYAVYTQEVQEVEKRNREAEKKYEQDLEYWKYALAKSKKYYEEHDAEIKSKLFSVYFDDIIYPKYQNFAAVASFYEYFESGRCSSLEGRYGAYNIYEDEKRKDMIISQINEVIHNLEAIRENQYQLYSRIEDIMIDVGRAEGQLLALNGKAEEIEKISCINACFNALN